MEKSFIRFCLSYLRVAPELPLPELEPLRVLELLLLDELRVLEVLLLDELRLELDAPVAVAEPVEAPLLRVVLLELPTRLLPVVLVPEGRLVLELPVLGRLGVAEPVEAPLLVVGRVDGPLALELGRLTLLPELGLPLELLPVLGRLGVAEPVDEPLVPVLWLPPELMLPPVAFGLTVAVGAGSLGAGGVTLWVAG